MIIVNFKSSACGYLWKLLKYPFENRDLPNQLERGDRRWSTLQLTHILLCSVSSLSVVIVILNGYSWGIPKLSTNLFIVLYNRQSLATSFYFH